MSYPLSQPPVPSKRPTHLSSRAWLSPWEACESRRHDRICRWTCLWRRCHRLMLLSGRSRIGLGTSHHHKTRGTANNLGIRLDIFFHCFFFFFLFLNNNQVPIVLVCLRANFRIS